MKKRFHEIDNEKPKTVNSFAQTNARNIFEPQTDIMKSEEHSALQERYEDLEKEYEEEKKARREGKNATLENPSSLPSFATTDAVI